MIHVDARSEPDSFDDLVRQPGQKVLAQGATAVLKPYWRECIVDLRREYRNICAYLSMRIHPATAFATVDHFLPKVSHRAMTYEWSNFRLASAPMNTNKGDFLDVLDPFSVEDGWFQLNVASGEVHPAAELDAARQAEVQATIRRLKLNDPTYRDARIDYLDRYYGVPQAGKRRDPLPMSYLEEEAPFIASELKRQGRLR